MLATDPRVDLVSFTGSTATGRAVMAAAAPTLKKVFLELGGKSAAIVLDDADLAAAAGTAAFSVCIHAGQGCALTTRLVVPRERYDEAVEVAAATMASIGAKDPTDPGTICGPVINEPQRDRIERYLGSPRTRAAVRDRWRGASSRTASGSSRPSSPASTTTPGWLVRRSSVPCSWYSPTTATTTRSASPTTPLRPVRLGDSGRPERARAVANRIRTGTLAVNGGVWFAPDAPFGGYKQSGIGREMGVAGFEEYLETKLIAEGVK